MTDPYQVLGLPPDANDEAIRRRYLELVRQFSPEHHPERFAAVRSAYERLRDVDTRLRHRLFEAGRKGAIGALVEELACRGNRRRGALKALLSGRGHPAAPRPRPPSPTSAPGWRMPWNRPQGSPTGRSPSRSTCTPWRATSSPCATR